MSSERKKRVVFFGNSDLSLIVLKKLIYEGFSVLVITSPDKPKGRGLQLLPNDVKKFCVENKILFFEDENWEIVKTEIQSFSPDFFVVASYGKIIPERILSLLPSERRLNVHPSLLPRWRGPAPVQWTILSGDEEAGCTICTLEKKVDSGYILVQEKIKLSGDEDFCYLSEKLFGLGSDLICRAIEMVEYGNFTLTAQDESSASWARAIKKEDGFFSFKDRAGDIWRKMRAFCRWPKIYTKINGEIIKIHELFFRNKKVSEGEPGKIVGIEGDIVWVICGDGSQIGLSKVQRPGRSIVSGRDFINGLRMKIGDILSP